MTKFFNKKQILTPTAVLFAVILAVYLYSNKGIRPTVTDTTPADGSTGVLENSQISIEFNTNTQEEAKKNVSVLINPSVQFDSTWLSNSYKIIPKNNLQNNTKYTVSVLFKEKNFYSFSFETATFSQEDVNKYGKTQAQNDYVFGQTLNKFIEKNPWYTLLPIRTADYIIYYDSDQQKFSIAFTDVSFSQDKKAALVQKALTDLGKIGIKDPIPYYVYQP